MAHRNRGFAYSGLGKHQQAIKDYNKAIELDPQDAGTYYNRGVAYSKLDNHQQAIADIKTAAKLVIPFKVNNKN